MSEKQADLFPQPEKATIERSLPVPYQIVNGFWPIHYSSEKGLKVLNEMGFKTGMLYDRVVRAVPPPPITDDTNDVVLIEILEYPPGWTIGEDIRRERQEFNGIRIVYDEQGEGRLEVGIGLCGTPYESKIL
jgi:hypothetical protein